MKMTMDGSMDGSQLSSYEDQNKRLTAMACATEEDGPDCRLRNTSGSYNHQQEIQMRS